MGELFKGQYLDVYEDPLTQSNKLGIAKLIKKVSEKTGTEKWLIEWVKTRQTEVREFIKFLY